MFRSLFFRTGPGVAVAWSKHCSPFSGNPYYGDYPEGAHYDARRYEFALAAFREGQLLAEYSGRVVGYATSLIVQLDE